MPKYYGAIGFGKTEETSPGVFKERITEKMYSGDMIRNTRKLQSTNQVNDNINISNELSILADPFANDNMYSMRYVTFMGAKWKITNVEVVSPRLLLTIGGLYNGK